VPDAVHRVDVTLVAGDGGDVRHAAIKVHRADGVPDDLRVLADRGVILAILAVERAAVGVAALLDEELGQLQVALLAGEVVELDQGQLDLLVAGGVELLARSEGRVDVVDELQRGVEQVALAGRLVVGDGGLDQVAGTVQLVPHTTIRPTLLGRRKREIRVEVPVGLLGGDDALDQLIDVGFQLRITLVHQRVGRPLDHLVHVRVVEEVALELAVDFAGRLVEIAQPARFVALLETVRQRVFGDDLELGGPEFVGNPDVGEGYRAQLRVFLCKRHGADSEARAGNEHDSYSDCHGNPRGGPKH
jgi:hypothetical protein